MKMTDKIKKQILAVRETGLTNMFNINGVMFIAYQNNFYELVAYLSVKENWKEYSHFIITGEVEIDNRKEDGGNG